MTPFRFRLEKVLAFRRVQVELEEARYKQQSAAVAELDQMRAELEANGIRTEIQVRDWSPLTGSDLTALAGFRSRVQKEEQAIALRRSQAVQQLETLKRSMIEARRRYELLERLREKRLTEWKAAGDRELDELASESHLSALARNPGQ
jgi:flagellar export protein FliJ